jgi:dTDP-4-amino-4,6-dideoxygalactose transaminase
MIYYPVPLHRQKLYASEAVQSLEEAESAAREVLSLPMYPELSVSQIEEVAAAIREFYVQQREAA